MKSTKKDDPTHFKSSNLNRTSIYGWIIQSTDNLHFFWKIQIQWLLRKKTEDRTSKAKLKCFIINVQRKKITKMKWN